MDWIKREREREKNGWGRTTNGAADQWARPINGATDQVVWFRVSEADFVSKGSGRSRAQWNIPRSGSA